MNNKMKKKKRSLHNGEGDGKATRQIETGWNYKNILYYFFVPVIALVAYNVYQGYLETRIHTTFGGKKIVEKTGLDVADRFWGTYRPGVYFGMKHRSPKSLVSGLMWLIPSQARPGQPGLRHLCQQGDNLKKYGWLEHDGVNFGVQEIVDVNMKITTSFVKRQGGLNGGDWTNRIEVEPMNISSPGKRDELDDELLLVYYVAAEPGLEASLEPELSGNSLAALHGNTSELGSFIIRFLDGNGVLESSQFQTKLSSLNDISNTVLANLVTKNVNGKLHLLIKSGKKNRKETPNFFVHVLHVKGPFKMEVVYETASFYSRPSMLAGETFTEFLQMHRKQFSERFEVNFHLKEKGFNSSAIEFAQAAMSNLIGGIGYFYGASKVQSIHNSAPVPYWNTSLYTAVPSRSFFPRGFLWDEGFHLLLINKWNPEISVDIISHWLDLMNVEGWIPREQILGEEALIRVPDEFVVQRNDVANPPTLIMALHDLLQRHKSWIFFNHKHTLQRMWPKLAAWYQWLNRTQSGTLPTTFMWRGRNATTLRELNPKTLASGLDDFPRASHPSPDERHLDLRCWMALSSKLMADLADLLEYDGTKYFESYRTLTDERLLNELHWSAELNAYADYGHHSSNVVLRHPPMTNQQRRNPHIPLPEKIRYEETAPRPGFVNMFGYVNLFPMILQILRPESTHLQTIVKQLDSPNLLWTPYGLRSLAKNAPLYNKRNTEHDPPYWRGPIWININFLALKSLKYYSSVEGNAKQLSGATYVRLRENVISNLMRQYLRTGYMWEQYDDVSGSGKGCRPFTGWSSLVVLIMAEEY